MPAQASLRQRVEVGAFTLIALVALVFVAVAGYHLNHRGSATVALPPNRPAGVLSAAPVSVPASFGKNKLAIPAQSVTAPIQSQVVDLASYLGVPSDVHEVGYYSGGGKLDGATGDLLIAGHVNYVGQGTGALGKIANLHIGDALITRGAGAPQGWRVTALTSYLKTSGLPAAIFRATGNRALTLVTCGGVLDHQTGSYLSNIVVTAMPVHTIVEQ